MLSIHLGKSKLLVASAFLAMVMLTPHSSKADENLDDVRQLLEAFYRGEKVAMQDLAQAHQDPTYLTAGGGWNLDGNGHFADQILEADLNPHFFWFSNNKWVINTFRFDGFLNVTGRVRLRMSSEQSAPVRTPSFMPRATYYFWFGDSKVEQRANYYSLMLSHHSNGQDGPFYNPDGTVNTNSGSFSSNFVQLAHYHLANYEYFPGWTKISLNWHPGFNRSDDLKDQYEKLKLNLEFKTRPIPLPVPVPGRTFDWDVRNFSTISYTLSGRDYIVAPNAAFPGITPRMAKWSDNIHLSTEFHIKPSTWRDIRLFVKYDLGYDYYNIHFREKINRIQFGVSGHVFRLGG